MTDPNPETNEALAEESHAAETVIENISPATENGELEALREENAALKDQALRAMAEMENVRRRSQRDQEETRKYAVTGIARDLVNVAENLIRATQSIPAEARADNPQMGQLAEGVEMTLRELLSVLEKNHIKRIEPMGEKFDHNFHQAVTQIENTEIAPGTVVQVLQAGYVIHDRLLRPAMVGVAKGGEVAPIDTKA